MINLGQALKEAVESMTFCPSEDHFCPYCNQIVPKLTVYPLGIEKVVQPRCKCEVQAMEGGVQEASEKHLRNEIERKFAISALGERFEACQFGSFSPRQGTERAHEMAQAYARNFSDYGGESLLIWGEPGNGKSHLAAAICHELKAQGRIPVFQTMSELLERIRSTFRKGSAEHEGEIMSALRECDLLVIDDLGAEKISDWVLDVLFRIIDGRYRKKRPTLFTTNFSPTELLHRFKPERAGTEHEIAAKRIHDRIIEVSLIVENQASSYRMEVAAERVKRREPDKRRQWA